MGLEDFSRIDEAQVGTAVLSMASSADADRSGARVEVHLLSTRARESIVLRSDFVEAIQHFVAPPKDYNTQREDQKGGHFSISS